jgi:hypothetical protein
VGFSYMVIDDVYRITVGVLLEMACDMNMHRN